MLQAIVHAADIQDRDGGAMLMAVLFGLFPFLLTLYGDGGYQGEAFQKAVNKVLKGVNVEVVKRSGQPGTFVVLPKRWIVADCTKLPARPLSGWTGSSVFNCGPNFTLSHPS
jgi:hypothetical protein